jgi:ATP-dependent DNA helicase RecG
MTQEQLANKLMELYSLTGENEIVEFKEAKNSFDSNKLGKYFCALSNEANLSSKPCGWLVFGVENKHKSIVGSNFRSNRADLDSLKGEIGNKTTNRIAFIEIYELQTSDGRFVMFQIPPAPKGIPIAWEGHYYGRDGEELSPLNLEEIERIRSQVTFFDWSAQICSQATILLARANYKVKNSRLSNEIDEWDDITFLNKARVTISGKITNAAIE